MLGSRRGEACRNIVILNSRLNSAERASLQTYPANRDGTIQGRIIKGQVKIWFTEVQDTTLCAGVLGTVNSKHNTSISVHVLVKR